jgi:hypothetical protein
MTVATGNRVSLKTQAPLTLPGTLYTAGHWDQSRTAMLLSSFHRKAAGCSVAELSLTIILPLAIDSVAGCPSQREALARSRGRRECL